MGGKIMGLEVGALGFCFPLVDRNRTRGKVYDTLEAYTSGQCRQVVGRQSWDELIQNTTPFMVAWGNHFQKEGCAI